MYLKHNCQDQLMKQTFYTITCQCYVRHCPSMCY